MHPYNGWGRRLKVPTFNLSTHRLLSSLFSQDLTPWIKQAFPQQLADSCISNPSVVNIDEMGHLLLSFRVYSAWEKGVPCVYPDQRGGQWREHWKGEGGLGLLVCYMLGKRLSGSKDNPMNLIKH